MQDILRDADGEIGDLNAKLQEMTDAAESHAQKVSTRSSRERLSIWVLEWLVVAQAVAEAQSDATDRRMLCAPMLSVPRAPG